MELIVNVDGASRGNPGPASAGLVIRDRTAGKAIHEAGYLLGLSTNNVAEYNGLLKALEVLTAMPLPPSTTIDIHSDSQLMVRQITGEYRVKSPDLAPMVAKAQMLLRKLGSWKIHYVPREQNRRADELANMALDAGRDVIVISGDGKAASPETDRSPSSPVKKTTASASPASSTSTTKTEASLFTAKLTASPGTACPARCPAKTPFHFGPKMPAGFCVYAAQAVFDEDPTLWNISKTTQAQTQCPRCGTGIEIVLT